MKFRRRLLIIANGSKFCDGDKVDNFDSSWGSKDDELRCVDQPLFAPGAEDFRTSDLPSNIRSKCGDNYNVCMNAIPVAKS